MADFYIYNTEGQAHAANNSITRAVFDLLGEDGFKENGGGIFGKVKGVDSKSSFRTTTWSVSRQRQDGKWIVPVADKVFAAGMKDNAGNLRGDDMKPPGTKAVETMTADWFPDSTEKLATKGRK